MYQIKNRENLTQEEFKIEKFKENIYYFLHQNFYSEKESFENKVSEFINENPTLKLTNKNIDDIVLLLKDKDGGIIPSDTSVGMIQEKRLVLQLARLTENGYTPEFDKRLATTLEYIKSIPEENYVHLTMTLKEAEDIGYHMSYDDYISVVDKSSLSEAMKESLKAVNPDNRINMKDLATSYSKSYDLSLKLAHYVKNPVVMGIISSMPMLTLAALGVSSSAVALPILFGGMIAGPIIATKATAILAEQFRQEPKPENPHVTQKESIFQKSVEEVNNGLNSEQEQKEKPELPKMK